MENAKLRDTHAPFIVLSGRLFMAGAQSDWIAGAGGWLQLIHFVDLLVTELSCVSLIKLQFKRSSSGADALQSAASLTYNSCCR